jgi:hypothetical protein
LPDQPPIPAPSGQPAAAGGPRLIRSTHADCADPAALTRLQAGLLHCSESPADLALVVLFVSPAAPLADIAAAARARFAPAPVIGCTTAGEITAQGYSENTLTAVAFPRSHFAARCTLIPDLGAEVSQPQIDAIIRNRRQLALQQPGWDSEFAFVMSDGLSRREDALTAGLAAALGPVPLFGGSAGDAYDFNRTFVLHDGVMLQNAAVLAQLRSRCPVEVFKTDHLLPTTTRMVVTGADPDRRLVHEINAEPAAAELARILGKDPWQLSTFTFANHPLVVRMGGQHHVRAIQRVTPGNGLLFFSAIDEGVVLALAEPQDMAAHLRRQMQRLSQVQQPELILACDCVLRRVAAEQQQQLGAISQILSQNRVAGFSTYGEQLNAMHVNQTLTGVAIYPPPQPAPEAGS